MHSRFAKDHLGRKPFRLCGGLARSSFAQGSSGDHLIPPNKSLTRDSPTLDLKRRNRQFQQSGKLSVRIRDKVHLPSTFDRMGPAREIQLLTKSVVTPLHVSRFVADNAQSNLLKQVRGSLPGVSSAFRCYAAFCELTKVQPPPPPKEEIISRRSIVFNNAAAFGNYVSLLEKACFFPRFSTTWLTPAARHVDRGLEKCQDRSFRFPNFIRAHLLAKIVAHESARVEFASHVFLSPVLFPSSFGDVTASPCVLNRPLGGLRPQLQKALIGVRTVDGKQFLSAKLKTRKNLATGCILRRPRFSRLAAHGAMKMCPFRIFWAEVRRRAHPGQMISQSVTRRNSNRTLEDVLARLGIPSAERYSSHCFR